VKGVSGRARLVGLLFVLAAGSFAQEAVTPADSERRADLDRLQRRIGSLQARLAESE